MSLLLPRVIGHRGAKEYAPENTLESIHTAADLGVEWVELDVKLTKDQVPIIFHDDTLDRTTNGSGPVAEMLYDDICQLEAGSWFADSFAGIKIPSLEEALEVIYARNLGFNMEIKACPGREKETAEVALDYLASSWDDHNRLLISSFSHVSLEVAIEMAEDWSRGLLLEKEMPENLQEVVEYITPKTINFNADTEASIVEDLLDFELPLLCYTVNDPMVARRMVNMGVDCFFSDCPDVIEENLPDRH
jgi:glycerophosphoryl diester phosphodiesterase